MGTRSAVGVRNENGEWKGRYVHWDGYPSGVGAELLELIKRDGPQKVVQTVVLQNYGWSTLDMNPRGVPQDDGRFKVVPGYGVAYTEVDGQSSPNDWITEEDAGWTEFVYLIHDDGRVFYKDTNWEGERNTAPGEWKELTLEVIDGD